MAIVLLTISTDLSLLIALIPKAVLACILIVIGITVIDWRLLGRLHRTPVNFWMVMALTTLLVAFVDTLTGLVIGFMIGMFVNSRDIEDFEVPRLVSVPLADRALLGEGADSTILSGREPVWFSSRIGYRWRQHVKLPGLSDRMCAATKLPFLTFPIPNTLTAPRR